MDAVILNLLGDIPLVTRLWTIGCLVLSGLTSLRIVDPGKVVYSYDLVFKKGQYGKLIQSEKKILLDNIFTVGDTGKDDQH